MTNAEDIVTRFDVTGADCAWCFNEAIDALVGLEGVREVRSSIADECIVVRHRDVGAAEVAAVLRSVLHGTDTTTNEVLETWIEPTASDVCPRHRSSPGVRPSP